MARGLSGPSAATEPAAPSVLAAPSKPAPGVVVPKAAPWWLPLLGGGMRPLLLASDLLACALAAVLSPSRIELALLFAPVLLIFIAGSGLNRSRLNVSILDDLPALAQAWLMAVALMEISAKLLLGEYVGVLLAVMTGALVFGFRALSYALIRTLRRHGIVSHPTVVVGAEESGRQIVEQLLAHRESGLDAVGFLDADPADPASLPAPWLGLPSDLTQILHRHQPRALIVAHSQIADDELVNMIRKCQRNHCEFFVLPRLHQVTHIGHDMDSVSGMPLIRLRRAAYRSWSWRLKRLIDIAVAATALIVLSPVLLICALAVLVETGGVIFSQERVGVDGRRFKVLKFQSLKPADESESQTNWNISQDHRLGPVGRMIRRLSIDELPQLVNILRGDMSLVGPRPERPHFVAKFDQLHLGYGARHRVPCGLTGWAQVHGLRGDTSIGERARFDNFYIENWSLWLDLKILLMTVVSVVKSPGS